MVDIVYFVDIVNMLDIGDVVEILTITNEIQPSEMLQTDGKDTILQNKNYLIKSYRTNSNYQTNTS